MAFLNEGPTVDIVEWGGDFGPAPPKTSRAPQVIHVTTRRNSIWDLNVTVKTLSIFLVSFVGFVASIIEISEYLKV